MQKIAFEKGLNIKLLAILLAFSLVPLLSMGILSIMEMNKASKEVQEKITGLSTTLNRSALTVAPTDADQLQLTVAKANQYNEFFSRIKMENELVTNYASLESEIENCSIPNGIWIAPAGQEAALSGSRASAIRALCLPAKIMKSISEVEPAAALSFIGTTHGVLITWPNDNDTISRTTPFDYMDRPYYSIAQNNGKSSWTGPYRDENNVLKITYVSPIKRKNEFFGIIGMDVYLESLYEDMSSMGGRGYPFIINNSGSIILRPTELPGGPFNDLFTSDSLADINNSEIQDLLQKLKEYTTVSAIVSLQDKDAYIALAPIHSMKWSLGTIYPVEEMSLPSRFVEAGVDAVAASATIDLKDSASIMKVLFGFMIILTICIVLVSSLFISRRIGIQIDSLSEAIDKIANGKSDIKVKSSVETAKLSEAISKMAINLENRFYELEKDNAHLHGKNNKQEFIYKLKTSLAPDYLPKPDGYEITVLNMFSKTTDFDIYDVRELGNKFALSMAGVGGEGFQPAILAFMAKSLILASSESSDPSKVIADLNSELVKHSHGLQLTCFYALLDPAAHSLVYVNAGFNPPFIVDSEGIIDTLGYSGDVGIALGMLERIDLKSVRIPLQMDDVMVIYSNGFTEEVNGQKKYGINRLINIIKENREMPAAEIQQAVETDLMTYIGNMTAQKDITLMILKRA
ncbi:MAG: SpoIIE family protein phosphatase [Methanotrichaceae archaeon]|nr:SpoIIE family protein phosphatase [Methanotrichaceae archaeon]